MSNDNDDGWYLGTGGTMVAGGTASALGFAVLQQGLGKSLLNDPRTQGLGAPLTEEQNKISDYFKSKTSKTRYIDNKEDLYKTGMVNQRAHAMFGSGPMFTTNPFDMGNNNVVFSPKNDLNSIMHEASHSKRLEAKHPATMNMFNLQKKGKGLNTIKGTVATIREEWGADRTALDTLKTMHDEGELKTSTYTSVKKDYLKSRVKGFGTYASIGGVKASNIIAGAGLGIAAYDTFTG